MTDKLHPTLSQLPIAIHTPVIEAAMETAKQKGSWCLVFVLGTKACFSKCWGSMMGCERHGIPFFVIDANQHYDENLTRGLHEFGIRDYVGANFQIRGSLNQKAVELFLKTDRFAKWLLTRWPTVTAVPVVCGDTILCPAISQAWLYARGEKSIHNEAGLRSKGPDIKWSDQWTIGGLCDAQWAHCDWSLNRAEPFPEQICTFSASAASEHHMTPCNVNTANLAREGYPCDHIHQIGGLSWDALQWSLQHPPERSIFDIYPVLGHGKWVRIDIHRKCNLGKGRFSVIWHAIEQLVHDGLCVNLVLMNGTQKAIEQHGFHDALMRLTHRSNFLATEVWPNFGNVIEFYMSQNFMFAATDSGGVQEDMSFLNKPCCTIRFTTDRPESVWAENNVLVAPTTSTFVSSMIEGLASSGDILGHMARGFSVYGDHVGEKFAQAIKPHALGNEPAFRWCHDLCGWSELSGERADFW